jgi:tellurite resistance-related uncharacterized protein
LIQTNNKKIRDDENKFLASGTYQLTCPDCGNKSVGQASRFFATDVKNIFSPFKSISICSKFAQLHLEKSHSSWKTENVMQVLHYKKKSHMNRIVKFHIYKGTINDKQVNEKHTITTNKVFGTTVRSEALKGRSDYANTFHLNHPKRVQ